MSPASRPDRARRALLIAIVVLAAFAPTAVAGGTGATRAWLPIPADQTRAYNLSSMQQRGNAGAFASLASDGSVYVWGDPAYGGDWSRVSTYLTAATPTVQVFSNQRAFAAVRADGSVVAWGDPFHGGDQDGNHTPRIIEDVHGVRTMASTAAAFAVIQSNGAVNAWGDMTSGGDPAGVPDGCSDPCVPAPAGALDSGVRRIVAADGAFAALKDDGSVVTWGYGPMGGDSSAAAGELGSGVVDVVAGPSTFAALKDDGSVVTWGNPLAGGDAACATTDSPACSPAPPGALSSGVVRVYANAYAFAALKDDGAVVTWGDPSYGGALDGAAAQLGGGVVAITPTLAAFAALKSDGSVVAWGGVTYGGDPNGDDANPVADQLASGVVRVFANRSAFAALKDDGAVVTWGASNQGGYGPTPCGNGCTAAPAGALASGVMRIVASMDAFAALKADGSVVTWGYSTSGGDSAGAAPRLAGGVIRIVATEQAFAALKEDGSVVPWGNPLAGGAAGAGGARLDAGVDTVASPLYAPAYLPGAPTDVRVAPPALGVREVTVTFTPPVDDGGAPISGATATCSSTTGGATATATVSAPVEARIAVDGLTLGATYTCTVAMRNAVGTGPASDPSDAFTTTAGPAAGSGSASTRIPRLPMRTTCGARGACTFHGAVPAGTTRVVLVATRLVRGRAIARVTRRCAITGAGTARTYACVVQLPRGRWSVAIRALAGRTVLAQAVDQVRIRAWRPGREPVTG